MATSSLNRNQQGLVILGISFIVTMLFAWFGVIWAIEYGEEPIVGSLIWTGRLAFAIFLIPLFASPLRALFRNPFTAQLMRWRRNAGVCYGGMQLIHLILILVMFDTLSDPPTEETMVAIGGIGMLLCMGMLVTSFERPTKAIGRKYWLLLHKCGFYVFMFIYLYDFVIEPLMLGSFASYAVLGIITLTGMSIRTFVMLKKFSKRPLELLKG
jgi:DMSO/TMAO reductase YedYZ heme-binding membrane subunit